MTDALKELLRETGCFDPDDDFRQLEEVQSWYYIRRLLNAVREAYILGWDYGADSERGSGNDFHSDLIHTLQMEAIDDHT